MPRKAKHHTDKFGALEFKKLKRGGIEWCSTSHKSEMNKSASHVVYIIGIPTTFLCNGCKKEWIKLWKETSPIKYI